MTKNYLAIDAFCGAGGLSLGLGNAGFTVIGGFDLDAKCIETLKIKKQFIQHEVIEADIKNLLNGVILEKFSIKKEEIHLLAGGPPCQGFSVQRTVGEDHDERNLLVDDYADLILETLPKFFLLENVPGIGGKRGVKIMEKFKAKISSHGYFLHEKVLDAQDYGVPQRRKRFILIGEFSKKPKFTWPELETDKRKTVKDTIGHLPPAEQKSDNPMHRADKLSELNLKRIRAIKQGQSRVDLPEELLAECHLLDANKIGHRNVYGRMSWDNVAPTITARFDSFTRGKFGHPEQDRSVSLLEGALLQTFPEEYRFSGNKVEIARQIGNAVPPDFAKAIGKAIIKALEASE